MTEFSLDDLMRILRECAGEDETVDFGNDVGAVDFDQLGYDSLALMEASSRVARGFRVELPEAELAEVGTPAEFVALVNRSLRRQGTAEVRAGG